MDKGSTFYSRFQDICLEKGRSPTSVVTAAGLSSCLVTNWKNGTSPKLDTLMSLAQELGVSVTTLLKEPTQQSTEVKKHE